MNRDNLQATPTIDINGRLTTVYKKSRIDLKNRTKNSANTKAIKDMTGKEFFAMHKKMNPRYRKITRIFTDMLSFSPYYPPMLATENAAKASRSIYDEQHRTAGDYKSSKKFVDEELANYPAREGVRIPFSFITPKFGMTELNQMSDWDMQFAKRGLFTRVSSDRKSEVELQAYGMYYLAYEHIIDSDRYNPEPEALYIISQLHPLFRVLLEGDSGSSPTVSEVVGFIQNNPNFLSSYKNLSYWEPSRSSKNEMSSNYGNFNWCKNAYMSLSCYSDNKWMQTSTVKSRRNAMKWMAWSQYSAQNNEVLEQSYINNKGETEMAHHRYEEIPYNLARKIPFSAFQKYYDVGITDVNTIIQSYYSGLDPQLAKSLYESK